MFSLALHINTEHFSTTSLFLLLPPSDFQNLKTNALKYHSTDFANFQAETRKMFLLTRMKCPKYIM